MIHVKKIFIVLLFIITCFTRATWAAACSSKTTATSCNATASCLWLGGQCIECDSDSSLDSTVCYDKNSCTTYSRNGCTESDNGDSWSAQCDGISPTECTNPSATAYNYLACFYEASSCRACTQNEQFVYDGCQKTGWTITNKRCVPCKPGCMSNGGLGDCTPCASSNTDTVWKGTVGCEPCDSGTFRKLDTFYGSCVSCESEAGTYTLSSAGATSIYDCYKNATFPSDLSLIQCDSAQTRHPQSSYTSSSTKLYYGCTIQNATCATGQYTTPTQNCESCTNLPTSNTGSNIHYTGPAPDGSDKCPWEFTCAKGYEGAFTDTNDKSTIYCRKCDTGYSVNGGTGQFLVTNFIWTSSTGEQSFNATSQCMKAMYTLKFMNGSAEMDYRVGQRYNHTTKPWRYRTKTSNETWSEPDEVADVLAASMWTEFPDQSNIDLSVITENWKPVSSDPSAGAFKGFFTAASGGTKVFDANGKMESSITSTFFTDHTTLYPQWGEATQYSIKITLGSGSNIQTIYETPANMPCQYGRNKLCDISGLVQYVCSPQMYKTNIKPLLNNYGTPSLTQNNTLKFKLSDNGESAVRANGNLLEINISELACPAGYFCPQDQFCQSYKCPYGTTAENVDANTTAKTVEECYFKFTESTDGFKDKDIAVYDEGYQPAVLNGERLYMSDQLITSYKASSYYKPE